MTRVTENMLYHTMDRSIAITKERLFDATNRATSGIAVQKAADDPAAATGAMTYDSAQQHLKAMGESSARVATQLGASDAALADIVNVISRTREIAVDAANGDLSSSDRISLEAEIVSLRQRLLASANTKLNGESIFSGFRTDLTTFASDGTYQGDVGVRQIEVSPGIFVNANISGQDVLTPSSGVNAFALLQDLANDLGANDQAAIASNLDGLDTVLNQLTTARSQIGFALETITAADTNRANLVDRFTAARASLIEVDIAKSYTELAKTQQAYQSSISVASSVLQSLGLASQT
jgi:flagellar hook-associated protein 3 FlgL